MKVVCPYCGFEYRQDLLFDIKVIVRCPHCHKDIVVGTGKDLPIKSRHYNDEK
jgi:predicted Zn-ribbon and HTH transcriptional regulator